MQGSGALRQLGLPIKYPVQSIIKPGTALLFLAQCFVHFEKMVEQLQYLSRRPELAEPIGFLHSCMLGEFKGLAAADQG